MSRHSKHSEHPAVIYELFGALNKRDSLTFQRLLHAYPETALNDLFPVRMMHNTFEWTLLHAASYYGDLASVQALLRRSAYTEVRDTYQGNTALFWAVYGNHPKIAFLLLSFGARWDAKNANGQVAFNLLPSQSAEWLRVLRRPETPNVLIRYPADMAAQTPSDMSPSTSKRHTPTHDGSSQTQPTQLAFLQDIYTTVTSHYDSTTGRLYCDTLYTLPSPEELPEYYKLVSKPISLNMVKERMAEGYPTLRNFEGDMLAVFGNAIFFNDVSSRLYKDAKLLQRLYIRHTERLQTKFGLENEQDFDAFMSAPFNISYVPPPPARPDFISGKGKQIEEMEQPVYVPRLTPRRNRRSAASIKAEKQRLATDYQDQTQEVTIPTPTKTRRTEYGEEMTTRTDTASPSDFGSVKVPTPSRVQSRQLAQTSVVGMPSTPRRSLEFDIDTSKYTKPVFDERPQEEMEFELSIPAQPVAEPATTSHLESQIRRGNQHSLLQSILIEANDHSVAMALDASSVTSHTFTVTPLVTTLTVTPLLQNHLAEQRLGSNIAVNINDRRLAAPSYTTTLPGSPFRQDGYVVPLIIGANYIDIAVGAHLADPHASGFELQHFYLFVTKIG